MSRNNRNYNNSKSKQQSTDDRKKPPSIATDQAASERPTYDELFPPLSASSAVVMTSNPSHSTRNQTQTPTVDEQEQQQQQQAAASSGNVKPTTIGKKAKTWKPLSVTPQPMVLSSFILNSTTKNNTTTTRYESTDRSTARNTIVQSDTRPMTDREESIDTKLCEIILNIHLRQEFVSVERVEQELFAHYRVNSFRDLGVDHRNLKTLKNLIHRIKDVTFYMQIFEQIFNLCTLHDLSSLISKFLKVDTYEDAHLGPLDENPDVKRVFKYKPRKRHQSIPEITSGQVIAAFLDFQEQQQRRRYDYEEFLDELVEQNQLQKREELGIFCKSFPYLTEVTKKVTQDCNKHKKKVNFDAQKQIISAVEAQLWEIQQEVRDELEVSSYVNKSPMAVLDHLVSVVEKHLNVSQQKSVRDTLVKIRNDELLRCLFNISIYLGTIDKPEKFIAEFQKLNQNQGDRSGRENSVSTSQSSRSNKSMDNHNQNRVQQYMSNMQNNTTNPDVTYTTVETSFGNSSSSSYSNKTQTSLKQLCSDLFKMLARYDTVLTIKQLFDIKKNLCNQHSIKNFAEFGINDDEDDDNFPLDIISFLHIYRDKIDPGKELSIYENSSSMGDRQEIYSFVNQLTVINSWREKQQQDEYSNSREIPLSKDQLSAVEKAIQHKFGGALTNNRSLQIIKKAKNQYSKQSHSIIHFEESLLDEVSLNRLNIYPPSLLVDEFQVCQIILQCPIMTDLSTWLQWSYFFQSRYGSLKTFIARKAQELDRLLLLETSNHELLRLPIDSSLESFEKELQKGNIRSSVGHLCTLIITEHVQVAQLPFTIYRQVMHTWFIHLRSSAELQRDTKEPMQYVLEFLTYLPSLIGQSRIVQEFILEPLDQVFGIDEENEVINARQRIWMLANRKQRSKLEMWAYTLDIDEWKNENKWKGIEEEQSEESNIIQLNNNQLPKREIIHKETIIPSVKVPTTPTVTVIPTIPSTVETNIPVNNITNIDENNPNYAAFEHIKKIREGFGIDSQLEETGQKIVNNLQGVLKRSLEKLSNDLYSEQGHFVLELIQNADDNQYTSDCLPTLRFVVSSDRILVCNNEIGFQPNNINAICDVGNSTKGKHKQGYTGHKGIGFKSVFMVSHRPEIHSGNYHFCFDTINGTEQIGYIRPIWLENSDEIFPSINEWKTCIRLPIREDKRGDRLKRNFDDIHARLLLFLNRLRQIEIVRQKGNNEIDTQIFTRIDHAQGKIIELQKKILTTTSEKITKDFWLVEKLTIYVPENIKKQLNDVKIDVESTTIAIAYPLDSIHQSSSYEILSSQPLFAYLPLRSYGFHFILQGDFEIPVSRQEILRDNIWNEWLKKEMIKLLPLAYESFKNLPNLLLSCSIDIQQHFGILTIIDTLKYFIKMIPTRNNIDPYFNSFIDKTISNLMGIIQLPIILNENIQWISPIQCIIVRDLFIKQIFSQDLLLSHFNNYYLNEQFINECDESILIKLGCRRLDFSTILKLIRTLYTQNQQEYSTKTTTIEQIAQWFLCIDYSLQQERDKPGFNIDDNEQNEITTIDQLKQMKIIPLKDQTRLVSIEEFNQRTILFPLDKSSQFEKHLKIVLEDLPTIDERLIEYIEKKYPRRLESIKRLLKDLGISESRNVRRIYSNHILPIISNDIQWTTKSDSVLIAYLIFIYKELYSSQPEHFVNEIEKLKTKLILKTHEGKFVQINSNNIIHLTSLYGCRKSLDLLNLSKHRFQFLSDDYYNQYRNELFYQDRERNRFISFLNELHIQDFFLVKRIDNGFINIDQLVGTQWSHIIGTLSLLIFEPFTIQDYSSEEFDEFITSKDNNRDQYLEILLYLDHYYLSIAHYFAASIIKSRERHLGIPVPIQGVESSFCLSLRKYSWIPIDDEQLFKPTDVYVLSINNPFRRYVPCLDQLKVPLKNNDFIKLLGFKQEIFPITIFELFLKWSCNLDHESLQKLIYINNDQVSNVIPCTISTKIRQSCYDKIKNIYQIYVFLSSNDETRILLNRFRLWPIIYVPRTDDIGDFLYAHEVFWQDSESLIMNSNDLNIETTKYIALQPYYGNDTFSKQFFTVILQIKLEPTLDDYLLLLKNFQDKKIEYIWKCIKVITRLTYVQNKQSIIKDKCKNDSFIPCLNNNTNKKLVKYTDQPYYPHDMNIAYLFADIIPIINLTDDLIGSSNFKEQFCSLFNIEDLADVIKVLVDVDNPKLAGELFHFYSHSIELIQQFLFINGFLSETRSSHLQSVFADMNFISVDSIGLSYQYKENLVRKPSLPLNLICYIDESTRKFYILQKYENSDSHHIDTMVNYIILDESARLKLSQYIKILFKIYQNEGIQGLIKQKEKLPEQKMIKWIIPQVIKKESNLHSSTEQNQEEENESNDQSIIVTAEMIEKMKNEPGWELPKRNNIPIDPNKPKVLTSFPPNAGAADSIRSSDVQHTSESKLQQTDVTKEKESTSVKPHISDENNLNSSISTTLSSVSKTNDGNNQIKDKTNGEQVIPNESNKAIDGKKKFESNAGDRSLERSTTSHVTPLTIADFTTTQSPVNFEQIRISNFADIALSSSIFPNPPINNNSMSTNNETDAVIGRRGEEFVYRYLLWKYPKAQIRWINQQEEFGQPFDIEMLRQETGNQKELIEVKTTRVPKQNTFQISVGEVECLLENQSNYYIYRVYYGNDEKSSTITILSQIKCHLQKKQLALSITIAENSNQQ